MINVSNELKGQVKDVKIKNTVVLYDGKEVKPQSCTLDYKGNLFKTIMQSVELEIADNENIAGKDIVVQNGILVNGEFEYINYGTFRIKECIDDTNQNKIKATGYDKMMNFMIPFKLELTYPCTLLGFIKSICLTCNVELYNEELFNKELEIPIDYYTVLNASFRDVLEQVAEVTCSTLFIKEDKLYFSKINDTGEILEGNVTIKPKLQEKYGPINSLVLGRGSVGDNVYFKDDENIELNGLCEIKFDENEIADKRREEVIESMFNQVKGIEYYPFSTDEVGLGYFEPCDLANIKDLKGNIKKVLILNRRLTLTSGIKENISSEIPKQTTTKYQYATSTEKKVLKVERIADKQQGVITDIVEEQTWMGNEVAKTQDELNATQTKLSQTTQKVDSISDSVKFIGGINKVINSVGLYGTDKYTITGSDAGIALFGENAELKGKTDSGACVYLVNKTAEHNNIELIDGKQYTLTFKHSNTAGNLFKFSLDDTILVETTEEANLKEVVYTFVADSNVKYKLECSYLDNTKGGFYTDLIIKEGDIRSSWEPAQAEIMGTALTLYYNGLIVTSETSSIQTIINNLGFSVVDTQDRNNILIAINNLRVLLGNTEIDGYLKVKSCKFEEQVVDGDNLLFIG